MINGKYFIEVVIFECVILMNYSNTSSTVRGVSGVTGTLGKAKSHIDLTKVGDHTTMLRQLLIDPFLSKALPSSPNWNTVTKQLVMPFPPASCPPLSHFFSLRHLHLPDKSP